MRRLVYYMKKQDKLIADEVIRRFNNREHLQMVISVLIYVRIRDKWYSVFIRIDLFNREILGYLAGRKKKQEFVYQAFLRSSVILSKISIFHIERENEFKNKIIDELISTFGIKLSPNHKAIP